jgi:hypothetical protein
MLSNPSKLICGALFSSLLVFCMAINAKADAVEMYTGNPYNTFPVSSSGYTSSNFITATLSFSNPLPADASLAYGAGGIGTATATDPLVSFVMSDGSVTLNLSDSGAINIFLTTGSAGQIVDWFVGICQVPCNTGINIDSEFGVDPNAFDGSTQGSGGTILAYNSNDAGTWVSTTPEPSSLLLLATGLGLLGFAAPITKRLNCAEKV